MANINKDSSIDGSSGESDRILNNSMELCNGVEGLPFTVLARVNKEPISDEHIREEHTEHTREEHTEHTREEHSRQRSARIIDRKVLRRQIPGVADLDDSSSSGDHPSFGRSPITTELVGGGGPGYRELSSGIPDLSEEQILNQGWLSLYHQSAKEWKRYWFVLTEFRLYFFLSGPRTAGKPPQGMVPLWEEFSIKRLEPGGEPFRFQITQLNRTWWLKAESAKDLSRWCKALEDVRLNRDFPAPSPRGLAHGGVTAASEVAFLDRNRTGVFDPQQETILYQGWLTKRGDTVPTWKRRWFVLTEPRMYYFEGPKFGNRKPKGFIPLWEPFAVERVDLGDKEKLHFHIAQKRRVWLLRADTERDLASWLVHFDGILMKQKSGGDDAVSHKSPRPFLETGGKLPLARKSPPSSPRKSPPSSPRCAECPVCGADLVASNCVACSPDRAMSPSPPSTSSSSPSGNVGPRDGEPRPPQPRGAASSKASKLLGGDTHQPSSIPVPVAATTATESADSRLPLGRGKKAGILGSSFDADGNPNQGNDLAKVSKFFGTHISEGTAAALQKNKQQTGGQSPVPQPLMPKDIGGIPLKVGTAPFLAPASSLRRSTDDVKTRADHGEDAWSLTYKGVPSLSPNVAVVGAADGTAADGPATATTTLPEPQLEVSSGRLSLTLFRPTGGKAGTPYWLEVLLDAGAIYKSPVLHKKKPEWSCNFCADATLDSLMIVRLWYKGKDQAESVSLRLRTLPFGKETTISLEFPSGERCQAFLLALNFGTMDRIPITEDSRVPLEPPTVLDVMLESLYDLRIPDELWKRPFAAQVSFSDTAIRSGRLELVPDRCCLVGVNVDATFRFSPPFADRLQIQLVLGDSDVYALTTVNVRKLAENPANRAQGRVGTFLELRDASGAVRACAHLRYSLSPPTGGILSSFGQPLQGIPLRVDYGDVVLFNFKSLSAQLISAATQSSWDHVAIVYEEDGRLCVLEALSGGVQSVDANARMLDALALPGGCKIGIRRFVGARTREIKAQLWSFAIAMTGRSYKKNVSQLFGSRLGLNKADDLSSVFCSELVAAAFKHLDLLDESFVTSNVLPKDLAAPDFQLKRAAALGPIIVCSSKMLSVGSAPVTLKNPSTGASTKITRSPRTKGEDAQIDSDDSSST